MWHHSFVTVALIAPVTRAKPDFKQYELQMAAKRNISSGASQQRCESASQQPPAARTKRITCHLSGYFKERESTNGTHPKVGRVRRTCEPFI